MFKATQLPVNFSKLDVMGQLLDARREKAFLDWMNILSKTSEYKYAGKWLDENTPFCAYDTNKILVDGAALKFTQTTRHVDKISSLMSYSVWLLVNFESTYRIREVHSPEYAQMAETFEHYFRPHWEDKKKQPKPGLPDWVMGGV